jgi:hypothetical protein
MRAIIGAAAVALALRSEKNKCFQEMANLVGQECQMKFS